MSDVVIVSDSDTTDKESESTEDTGVTIESEDAVKIAEIQAEAEVAIAETHAQADIARAEAQGATYDEVLNTVMQVRDDIVSAMNELPSAVAAAVAAAIPPPAPEPDVILPPVPDVIDEEPPKRHWWYADNPVRRN